LSNNLEKSNRYSLRITLSTIIIGLLILAVGGTVAIILAVRTRSLDVTSKTIQKEVSQRVGNKLYDRFQSAEDLLREHLRLAERGLIPIDDPERLTEQLIERIRYDTRYEWLAFVRPDGLGGGAVRSIDGRIVLHLIRPINGGFELSRQVLNEDGTREPMEALTAKNYDYRNSPWYLLGTENTEPAWVKRYVRPLDGTYGWACAVSLHTEGQMVGVFGVGFGLAFMEDYLDDLYVAKTGRVFLLNDLTGEIRIGPSSEEGERLGTVVERAFAELPNGVKDLTVGETVSNSVRQGSIRYVVALEAQRLRSDVGWINALVIPEKEIIGFANRYLAIALSAVGVLFVIGLVLAGMVSKRVSTPLKVISKDLERVGEFDLSHRPRPKSMIDEIAVVGDSVDRMKASLRSFGHYVPTGLVRDLLSEGQEARLGGSVKNLTLFFSDVEGFTTVSEKMTPESLVDTLGEYLHVVTGVVAQCHGIIDKYIGDGILAFFNAPHDDPDHVLNACLCALRVQEALDHKREEWEPAGKPPFRTRIGLHTDDVVVGNIGTPERFSYTVIGDGVNLAARLESLNKAYGTWILVSESTRILAGDGFEWRRMDRTAVKGREKGEFVYELLGEGGKVAEGILRARDRYEAALDAYLDRRFAEAIMGFQEAAQLRHKDSASLSLGQRAEGYRRAPPPKDWDGVFVQHEK
jgi:adenylate cyclase